MSEVIIYPWVTWSDKDTMHARDLIKGIYNKDPSILNSSEVSAILFFWEGYEDKDMVQIVPKQMAESLIDMDGISMNEEDTDIWGRKRYPEILREIGISMEVMDELNIGFGKVKRQPAEKKAEDLPDPADFNDEDEYLDALEAYYINVDVEEEKPSETKSQKGAGKSVESNIDVVSKIQSFLFKKARAGDVSIGFHRLRKQAILIERINRIGLRKRLFSNRRQFLRDTIVSDLSAYHAVIDLICIEGIHEGKLKNWNGFGVEASLQFYHESEIMFRLKNLEVNDEFVRLLTTISKNQNP